MELGVKIQFILHESREVGAEDAGLVARSLGSVIANRRVFSKRNTDAHDLGSLATVTYV